MLLRKDISSLVRDGVRGAMLLAFLAAAPALARAQDLSCGPGDVQVLSLKFSGNKAISSDELALRVTTTPSSLPRRLHLFWGARRCLNRLYLPRDLAALIFYYKQYGYNRAKVDTVITPKGKRAVGVTFKIVEGPVTRTQAYRVTGLSGVPDSSDIVKRLRLKAGDPFNLGLFFADDDSIISRLRNIGYVKATTLKSYTQDTAAALASAAIEVIPGKRARFGEPVIHATPLADRRQQVPDNVVRRVIGISPGSFFSDNAVRDAQRSLYQLGVYRHIEVAPLADSLQPNDTTVILDVRLSEDLMRRIDTEWAFATLDCGRIRGQYVDQNFLRSARRFELTGQVSKLGFGEPLASPATKKICTFDDKSPLAKDPFSDTLHFYVGTSFRQPKLLGTHWTPTLSVYSERRGEYQAYLRTTRVGADLFATRDIGQLSQMRVGYTQEWGQTDAPEAVLCALFSRCEDASRNAITKLATLGAISIGLNRIATDNVSNPTRGNIMRAEFKTSASRYLGTSDSLHFIKGSLEYAHFMPLIGRNVLSLRVRVGAVQNPQNPNNGFVPPQERLYAGGANSIRGFQQNELGSVVYIAKAVPRDSFLVGNRSSPPFYYNIPLADSTYERVVPLGGNKLFVANLEYRVPDSFLLPKYLQYAFFIDAGNVWNVGRMPKPFITPGVGFRLSTPIGPMQLNLGYNPYSRPHGSIYYEDPLLAGASVSPLYCVSPGNTIPLTPNGAGVAVPPTGQECKDNFVPPSRRAWYERLAFTFGIGTNY